jgi:hypothetical protein
MQRFVVSHSSRDVLGVLFGSYVRVLTIALLDR